MYSPVALQREALPRFFPIHAPRTEPGGNLIFDVGMNNGDDSAYYLSKGYQVVAVEANPILVERARARFKSEIAAGQLLIEPVAIIDWPGKAPFWINPQRDVFSSFDRARAGRDGMPCYAIDVQCITFDTLLKKYGVPYYLKLDAEGAEISCLKCLRPRNLPTYVSVEAERFELLLLLWQAGYREFKIVDQMKHNSSFSDFGNENVFSRAAKHACWYADRFKNRFTHVPFTRGCSGPFGEQTRGEWQTCEEVAYNWLHLRFGYHNRGTLNRFSWFDFHAKAPTDQSAVENETRRERGLLIGGSWHQTEEVRRLRLTLLPRRRREDPHSSSQA